LKKKGAINQFIKPMFDKKKIAEKISNLSFLKMIMIFVVGILLGVILKLELKPLITIGYDDYKIIPSVSDGRAR